MLTQKNLTFTPKPPRAHEKLTHSKKKEKKRKFTLTKKNKTYHKTLTRNKKAFHTHPKTKVTQNVSYNPTKKPTHDTKI